MELTSTQRMKPSRNSILVLHLLLGFLLNTFMLLTARPGQAQAPAGNNPYYYSDLNPYYKYDHDHHLTNYFVDQCTWYVWGRCAEANWNLNAAPAASTEYSAVTNGSGKGLTAVSGAIECSYSIDSKGNRIDHVAYVTQVTSQQSWMIAQYNVIPKQYSAGIVTRSSPVSTSLSGAGFSKFTLVGFLYPPNTLPGVPQAAPGPQVAANAVPQIGTNADGSLIVLVLASDGSIWSDRQTFPNSDWKGWERLGGNVGGDPIIGKNQDGRLEFFVVGKDGHLYSKWETSTSGPWTTSGGTQNSGWEDYGTPGGGIVGNPAVGRNQDGRIQVYVRNQAGYVYTTWQQSANGNWYPGWQYFDGYTIRDLAVVTQGTGHQEVFALGGNQAIYSKYQSQLNGNWDIWGNHGGYVDGKPVVSKSYNSSFTLLVRGTDGVIYFKKYNEWNGAWSTWDYWGQSMSVASNPAVEANMYGLQQVFVRGWDNAIYTTYMPGQYRLGWESLGGNVSSDPAVGREQDGRLHVVVRGNDAQLYQKWQKVVNNQLVWSDWDNLR